MVLLFAHWEIIKKRQRDCYLNNYANAKKISIICTKAHPCPKFKRKIDSNVWGKLNLDFT